MKRTIPILVFLLILSACSNWKYGGKVKVSGNEVEYSEVIIEKNKVEPLVFDIPSVSSKDFAFNEVKSIQQESIDFKKVSKLDKSKDVVWTPFHEKVVENEDSIRRQDQIIEEARKTERLASRSIAPGVAGAVLSFTPLIIVGLIFSIIGLKRSHRALKAQYITPKGLKSAKIGFVFSLIGVIVSSLVILLFLFLLFLLLLMF